VRGEGGGKEGETPAPFRKFLDPVLKTLNRVRRRLSPARHPPDRRDVVRSCSVVRFRLPATDFCLEVSWVAVPTLTLDAAVLPSSVAAVHLTHDIPPKSGTTPC